MPNDTPNANSFPRQWVVEGSLTGGSWTIVDQRTRSSNLQAGNQDIFGIISPTVAPTTQERLTAPLGPAYRYFRLRIERITGSPISPLVSHASVDEWQLFTTTTLPLLNTNAKSNTIGYSNIYAFDNSTVTGWRSAPSTYPNGSAPSGSGNEWIGVYSPDAFYLTGYDIRMPVDTTINISNSYPYSWNVQARSEQSPTNWDESGWVELDKRDSPNFASRIFTAANQSILFGSNPTTASTTYPTLTATQQQPYNQYRLVIRQINSSIGVTPFTYTSIGEFKLYGQPWNTDSKYVSQSFMEFDIRTNTDNTYRGGTQTSLYSGRPFIMTQVSTFGGGSTGNSFTQLTTSQVPHISLTPSGTLTGNPIIEDDTEVGVFLANAWTAFRTDVQTWTPPRTVVTNTNATGAKVIFYYRTLFN